ncbi:type I-B CRISPR-associated protein Cas7/Cst2/DevR [Limosilactobacillus reuteri]|uniref:type I-B CRISPR-associated protein Cas7/Cst2/DevR n=1 Tax=Limosilactobacillus reuteri TaxID=1598 RepID=UPI00235DDD19|nr:type I-B CRISPR-associated protein Cas7/Cst2/DevR [Limosilactobacillus reuteri]MDD1406327.1 type I-B CRISPR-associated protein Cas7/Cst2/DevR [Limosilactobacillus reuteri]
MTQEIKGLTTTIIFQANSANYGESLGNVTSLKKLTRAGGYQYTYISRQALRYNIVNQLAEPLAKLSAEGSGKKKVIQFAKDANIENAPEVDFFGYMKTEKSKSAAVRSAKVRLSNAISQEPFEGDTDFLTNMGLATRIRKETGDSDIKNSIAQSEIQESYYVYTITIDLDQIGIDIQADIDLPNNEKARRVEKLLSTIQYLYRDIRGRREDLKPLFIIGGVYEMKNPFFENAVKVKKNNLQIETLLSILVDTQIRNNTEVGIIDGIFENTDEIKKQLNAKSVPQFFNDLKKKVADYYAGN